MFIVVLLQVKAADKRKWCCSRWKQQSRRSGASTGESNKDDACSGASSGESNNEEEVVLQ